MLLLAKEITSPIEVTFLNIFVFFFSEGELTLADGIEGRWLRAGSLKLAAMNFE